MNKIKKLNKLFLILVSVQTILMGAVFIIQILRIFYGNNAQFTRKLCGKYILQILPIILIWITLIVISYIYHKLSNSKDRPSKITNIGKLKIYENMCPEENDNILFNDLKKESKKRKIAWIINITIIVICSLMGLLYLINVDHFNSQGNLAQQAVQMTIHLIPWVIISFISLIICLYYEESSAYKSIEIIKAIISKEGKNKKHLAFKKNKKMQIIRISIIVIAICFIIHGIINGGASDVLQKAINICTECIGLG